ncbi:MAG: ABC transporter ATP-binding protein, partial [Deinococcus sp.]
ALARALAPRPGLLLLDEPLSTLDERLRASLRRELRSLFRPLGSTALLVTHDQREAQALASRLALMRAGRLVQVGDTAEVFARPLSAWAAEFLGQPNLLPRPGGEVLMVPALAFRLGQGEAWPLLARQPWEGGERVWVRHELGELTLDLSPREAAQVCPEGDGSLRFDLAQQDCLLLPDDR